jgi:hypothetical protein
MSIRDFLFVMMCLWTTLGWTQQSVLQGVVSVFNSKYDSGKTEYLVNAAVEEALGRSQATLTLSDGSFQLHLVGVNPMSGFQFTVTKEPFEVVNSGSLHAVAGQLAPVRIYMAPRGRIADNKRRFYNIGKTASERALERKIEARNDELALLRADKNNNHLKIKQLEREVEDLQKRYQDIDQNALELAERFSRVNLDDASDLYQRAFRQFQNGNIDSALVVLDEVDWSARVDSILLEETRLLKMRQRIELNDSLITVQRDSLAGAIRLKSASELSLGRYRDALHTEELLLPLYERETDALPQNYERTAWLALLAQDYAVARLYAERADAERSIVYARYFLGDTQAERDIAAWKKQAAVREAALSELEDMRRAGLPQAALNRILDLLR